MAQTPQEFQGNGSVFYEQAETWYSCGEIFCRGFNCNRLRGNFAGTDLAIGDLRMSSSGRQFEMAIVWLAYFAIAEIISLFPYESHICLFYINESQFNQGANQKYCADLFSLVQIATVHIGQGIIKHPEVLTALASIAIAAFTWTLWRSTNKLWEAGEKQRMLTENTAERQLRAHVHVADATIIYTNPNEKGEEWAPNIRIKYNNYGQTPAYKLAHRCNWYIQWLGIPDFEWALPPPDNQYRDLGPGQDMTTSIIVPLTMWQANKSQIAKRKHTLYAFGEITYFDAFKPQHRRSTKYRFQLAVDDDGIKDGGLLFSKEGNESD